MNIDRRSLLKLIGLAGASYMLPSLGRAPLARADAPKIPTRIVFFYTQQGTLKPLWAPSAPGAPDPLTITEPWSTRAHTLGELHGPLASMRDKVTFLDNLDMISSIDDPTGAANGHVAGETHALTAVHRQTPELAGGLSIDQFIAQQINAAGPVTRVPSLELGINAYGGEVNGTGYVRYPRTPDKDLWPTYSRGVPHNDLFVALANMMGVATSTFGDATTCTGALKGLR